MLHALDFLSVEGGGVTALLGANGAGKTTTLRAVCGMIRASGEITFAGVDPRPRDGGHRALAWRMSPTAAAPSWN